MYVMVTLGNAHYGVRTMIGGPAGGAPFFDSRRRVGGLRPPRAAACQGREGVVR